VLDEYGSHALTLDHVGAYLAAFCDGDPAAAAWLEEPRLDSNTPKERKLARVLRAYERALSSRELDLLARFCIFRTGASSETLHSIFSRSDARDLSGDLAGCTEAEFRRIVTRLAGLHLLLPEPGGGYTAHPAVRDHFYRIFTDAAAAHRVVGKKLMFDCGLDMAQEWEKVSAVEVMPTQDLFGREFRACHFKVECFNISDFSARLRGFLSRHGQRLSRACTARIDGCIRALEDGSEAIPLPDLELSDGPSYTDDDLRHSWLQWLHRSALSPSDGESDACEAVMPPWYEHFRCGFSRFGSGPRRPHLERLSWSSIGDAGSRQPHEEWMLLLHYQVVLGARQKMIDQLRGFLSRHEQWLSRESVGRINDCIRALEGGSEDFELPDLEPNTPGVTLRFRPGSANPKDPGLLDALEEVIYHTVRSGNETEGYRLYSSRMGGREHLGKVLGEFARGARILRYFRACPNDLDLAWYLRGVGDLRASFDLLSTVRPIWSGAVLCLQGFLPRVVRDRVCWQHSQVIAAFLMGRPDALEVPFDLGWGEALVNADLPLMKGQLARARAVAAADLKKFNVPEQVRTRLVLAEVERREGQTDRAFASLEREAPWILRSGSVEHLCLYHLIRSRALTDRGEYEAADSESREGLILSRQCGLGLAQIDFLNLRSRIDLARARAIPDRGAPQRAAFLEAAERSAVGALTGIGTEDGAPAPQPDMPLGELVAFGAQHPECQYAWGTVDALTLLGAVFTEQGRPSFAREVLRLAVDIQSTLQHPDLARTEELLSRLGPCE
jgi:hypothetical protein